MKQECEKNGIEKINMVAFRVEGRLGENASTNKEKNYHCSKTKHSNES